MNVHTASLNVNVSILLEMLHRILLHGNVTETERERDNVDDYKQNSLPSQK
jgi:hypothetical protein